MKKIMFHLHCLRKGGAERVVVNLAEKFIQNQYEVIIVLTHQAEDDYEISPGIRKIFAGYEKEKQSGRVKNFIMRLKHVRRVIKKEKPDIIISFAKNPNYRALLAAIGCKIPVLVSVRNDPKVDYIGKSAAIFNKLLLENAAGCVFQTKEAQEFFSPKLQRKSRVILNPIHEKYMDLEVPRQKEKVIINVGRLAEQKNHMLLIKAFEKLHQRFPEYQLKIYGGKTEDDTDKKLSAYVKERGLELYVHFMGIRDDLEKELPKAEMFVLSSNYEGMPNVVMEAMAMGLPVIATDCPCGGPGMLIRHKENGLLVPVDNIEVLCREMEWLIRHTEEAEKIGMEAKKIRTEANIDKVYAKWEEYVSELISGRKTKA